MNGGGQYGNIIVPSDDTLFKYHWPVTLADVEEPIENPLEFALESFRNCFIEDEDMEVEGFITSLNDLRIGCLWRISGAGEHQPMALW
ncbi:uncharacterized protein AKAW2_51003A [Aspergillus luchuensis]|nr:uncharacterized protein AKAW2_51003A [Aspergillus luchuensis]BCS00662.1 hypothetical protein AKAW2_51003A [Aspergillus luchuensis]BCS12428.1 hypothetical protein ALUC_50474A [Aspergillus luchuensis]